MRRLLEGGGEGGHGVDASRGRAGDGAETGGQVSADRVQTGDAAGGRGVGAELNQGARACERGLDVAPGGADEEKHPRAAGGDRAPDE